MRHTRSYRVLRRWRARACLAFALAGSEAGAQDAATTAFAVAGELRVTSPVMSQVNMNLGFRAVVAGASWRIDTCYEPRQWERAGSDGTNTFSFMEWSAPSAETTIEVTGTVHPGDYPQHSTEATRLVWLAYASGGSLAKGATPLAPWARTDSPLDMSLVAKVQASTEAPGLPNAITFAADSNRWAIAREQMAREPAPSRVSEVRFPFARLSVMGSYEALAFTNLGGQQVPVLFQFTKFGESRDGKAQPVQIFTGRATNILAQPGEVAPPAATSAADILDYRLSKEGIEPPVKYRSPTGAWPGLEDSNYVAFGRAQIQGELARAKQPGVKRISLVWPVRVALLSILVAPCFALLLLRRRRRRIS